MAAKRGWDIDSAESFNFYSRRKKDLFNIIDLVALDGESIIGIQATSGSNCSARVKKMLVDYEYETTRWLQSGGRLIILAWRKLKGKRALQYREIEFTYHPDFGLGWKES